MNLRMVGRYLSYLLAAEAAFLLPAAGVAALYAEKTSAFSLLGTAALTAAFAAALYFLCRAEQATIYAREGFVVAGAGWVLVSFFGALPFVFSGEIPSLADAFFESVSGFTTTGASILTNVEALSHGMLFWRSFTHWMGGIGVLAFILAIVRSKSGTGFTMHLLRAETPGPQVGKVMPKTQDSVRSLFLVYGLLSLVNLIFLLAGGMPLFDALCTMFGTAGTGGFGIKNDSMAGYSPYLQTVTTIFMLLFGVNFSLYYLVMRRQWRTALRDEELRLYLGIFIGAAALICLSLVYMQGAALGHSLHHSAFTVSSIMTTTGYATVDFDLWPQFARTLILVLMVCGAMAGSTGGGFKTLRLLILLKSMAAGIYRLVHPRSVKTVQINKKTLDKEIVQRAQLYVVVYCVLCAVGMLLLSLDSLSIESSLSAVLSCINNIGPGLGQVGPTANYALLSPFSTVMLAVMMLLGRLEIFPILLLFFPGTWSRKA